MVLLLVEGLYYYLGYTTAVGEFYCWFSNIIDDTIRPLKYSTTTIIDRTNIRDGKVKGNNIRQYTITENKYSIHKPMQN